MKKYFIIWLVIWVVIAIIVMIFVKQTEVLYGVGLAALISFVFMFKTLSEAWSGEITEIKKERVDVSTGDSDPMWEDRDFAYLKLDNGKTKKTMSVKGWAVGDRLEKKKGETYPKVLAK